MGEKPSFYIASRYHLLRRMICSFLSSKGDMTVLGEAADGETAYKDIMDLRPQLVLLDIDLPELSGLKLTERILAELPSTRIIAVTVDPEETFLMEFMRLGGMGYLRDCRSESDILTAVQRAMDGKRYLEDTGIQLLFDLASQNMHTRIKEPIGDDVHPQVLSDRERQVLHLYARGYNSVDIASMLLLSASTVGTYIGRIREKLNLEKKADIVEYANKYQIYDDWR